MAFLNETGLATFLSYLKAWARATFVNATGDQTVSGTKTYTSTIQGNASTASALASPFTISLTGAVSGSASTNGTGTAAIAASDVRASLLYSTAPNSSAQRLYFTGGQRAIGNSAGNVYKGSSSDVNLISAPENGTAFSSTTGNVQNIRLVWSGDYFSDLFFSPNNNYVWHRNVSGSTAKPWRRIVEENATGITAPAWNISISGNAGTVNGHTVASDVPSGTVMTVSEMGAGYIRYSNGLQMCFETVSIDTGTSTSSIASVGDVYYGSKTVAFPKAFSAPPVVTLGGHDGGTGFYNATYTSLTASTVMIEVYGRLSGVTCTPGYFAIGSWA